jgi:hypothetical protein
LLKTRGLHGHEFFVLIIGSHPAGHIHRHRVLLAKRLPNTGLQNLSSLEPKGSSTSTCMACTIIPEDTNLLHQSKVNRLRGFFALG